MLVDSNLLMGETPELTVDQREHESGQREAAQSQRGRVGEPPVVDWESGLALFGGGGGDEVMSADSSCNKSDSVFKSERTHPVERVTARGDIAQVERRATVLRRGVRVVVAASDDAVAGRVRRVGGVVQGRRVAVVVRRGALLDVAVVVQRRECGSGHLRGRCFVSEGEEREGWWCRVC